MFKGGKYPVVKAADVCDFITKGTTPASSEITTEPKENSIPYLKVYNLSFDGSLLFFDAPQYISREIHEGKLSRSKVYPNDSGDVRHKCAELRHRRKMLPLRRCQCACDALGTVVFKHPA